MRLADLPKTDAIEKICNEELVFRTGPFVISLKSPIKRLQDNFLHLYQNYHLAGKTEFVDFRIHVKPPANLRAWYKPQAYFYLDSNVPFKPLPLSQAFPMLEWGMNWCISNNAHQYLIIHAAVVERNGKGILMPAPPGSGKSTLCAGLVSRGWRLLSDELALFSVETGELVPLARPINLKNESIDVMQQYSPESIFSDRFLDTNKGTVALMAAPKDSVDSAPVSVPLRYVVFPRYASQSALQHKEMSQGEGFIQVVENAFNYSVLGLQGYELLVQAMEKVEALSVEYSELDDAVRFFNELVDA